jgi:stearoyl-CoA desaturase (delta-9 desaturase)
MVVGVDTANRSDGVIRARYVAKYQRRHVFYCNFLPLLGSLLTIGLAIYYPPHLGEWLSLGVMWLFIGTGVTVGYHRYFTHQAFEAGSFVRLTLAILGSMSALGPLVAWVSTHRRHHQLSDREGDPHSPNLNGPGFRGRMKGLWYAQFGWMLSHPMPNPVRYAKDILRDPRLKWVNRMYYCWVLLGVLLPGIVLGVVRRDWYGFVSGCLWGGFLRIFLTSQLAGSINSLCHSVGSRPFQTREQSTNNAVLAVPTWGEAWHNNHHAFPKSARFGYQWWQLDIGYMIIGTLRLFGLAWNVWTPSDQQVARAKASATPILENDSECLVPSSSAATCRSIFDPAEPPRHALPSGVSSHGVTEKEALRILQAEWPARA